MKFKMRLCIKAMKDVEIETDDEKAAIRKGKEMLKHGLKGDGVEQVEYIETGKKVEETFGKLHELLTH